MALQLNSLLEHMRNNFSYLLINYSGEFLLLNYSHPHLFLSRRFSGHSDTVRDVILLPDGNCFSCSEDKSVIFHNIKQQQQESQQQKSSPEKKKTRFIPY